MNEFLKANLDGTLKHFLGNFSLNPYFQLSNCLWVSGVHCEFELSSQETIAHRLQITITTLEPMHVSKRDV